VRERRRSNRAVAWRKFFDRTGREAREVFGGARERDERRAARLVRERDRDVGARGERLDQRPLGAGQVFEPIGKDRRAHPRVEIGAEPVDCGAPAHASVGSAERLQLRPVRPPERAELAGDRFGLEQPRLELVERLQERFRKASPRRRLAEAAEIRTGEDAAHEE